MKEIFIESPKKSVELFKCKQLYQMLEQRQKQIVYDLIFDLLPDGKTQNSGFYFRKLLEMKNVCCNELANYIYAYIQCMDINEDNKDLKQISNTLEALQRQITVKDDNYITKFVCDFFSISEDVLKYGYGKKYILNMDIVNEIIKNEKGGQKEFAEKVFYKVIDDYEDYNKDCEEYMLNSSKILSETIKNEYYLKDEVTKKLLHEEEFSLIEDDMFMSYFYRLKDQEKKAVFHLMQNLKELKKEPNEQ